MVIHGDKLIYHLVLKTSQAGKSPNKIEVSMGKSAN